MKLADSETACRDYLLELPYKHNLPNVKVKYFISLF